MGRSKPARRRPPLQAAPGSPGGAGASARPSNRAPSTALVATLVVLAVVHFHRLEIFGRALIQHDDARYVGPLATLSLAEYFGAWLPAPDHYAFPLRDLTFWLDFRLGAILGVQLVWVTAFVYFAAVLWALWGIAATLGERFGFSRAAVDLFVAVMGLHPTFVEVVQWASIRKHLLPALFVALGTRHALRLYLLGRAPRGRDWALFTVLHVAALLCYPSAALWLVWPVWLFRARLRGERRTAAGLLGVTGALLVATAVWVVGRNSAFSTHAGNLATMRGLPTAAIHWLESVGRGFANFALPVWISPYYTPHSPLAWAGLALALAAAVWTASRLRSVAPEARRLALDLFVLAALLFIPSSYVLFNADEYIWGDHYAYLPAPYLLLGLGLLVPAAWDRALRSRAGAVVAVVTLALLAVRAGAAAEMWSNDLALFGACADGEGAPRCTGLVIEKEFDSGRCALAERHVLAGRARFERQAGLDGLFDSEVPFYDAVCVALRTDLTLAQANEELARLRVLYHDHDSLLFARVLAPLRHRDVPAARALAEATYLDPSFTMRDLTPRGLDFLRGQARALSELVDGDTLDRCRAREAELRRRLAPVPLNPAWVEWGRLLSLEPFITGSRLP